MLLCRHCLKLSKTTKSNGNWEDCCPKCLTPINKPAYGNPPLVQTGSSHDESDRLLPPGFGGVAYFEQVLFEMELHGWVVGRMLLAYAYRLDIPGTNYCTILPAQWEVSRKIVAEKCRELLAREANGVYPFVTVRKNTKKTIWGEPASGGHRMVLGEDHHHTFVAALKSQVPVWLYLLQTPAHDETPDWTVCKYVDSF
jgi:hypothetical protein